MRKFWRFSGVFLLLATQLLSASGSALASEIINIHASVTAYTYIVVDDQDHISQIYNNGSGLATTRILRDSLAGKVLKPLPSVMDQYNRIKSTSDLNRNGLVYKSQVINSAEIEKPDLSQAFQKLSW